MAEKDQSLNIQGNINKDIGFGIKPKISNDMSFGISSKIEDVAPKILQDSNTTQVFTSKRKQNFSSEFIQVSPKMTKSGSDFRIESPLNDSAQNIGVQGDTKNISSIPPIDGKNQMRIDSSTIGIQDKKKTSGKIPPIGGIASPMPQPGMAPPNQMMTGVLRQDLEIIFPGKHGNYTMLFDRNADAYYRMDPDMLEVISYMNVSEPVDVFLKKMNDNGVILVQEELLQILGFLQQNNLLAPEYGRTEAKLKQQKIMKEKTAFLRMSSAYLFFRLPPWRPEHFFEKIGPYVSWLASKYVIYTLCVPAFLGYLLMIRNFGEVKTTFLNSLSWATLAKYFVAIMFVKVIHECAHSLAAIHFKCRVRGIGVGFMVFYPRLYTDTTDSWRLPRSQRLLIDAAGVIIELIFGGIAALLWCYLPPGAWRSTMFYLFAVSTISTLFVNGNPCIRYDGYYILCDVMKIENLMTRSSEYIKEWFRWYAFRLGSPPESERPFFLFVFGICSFIYRFFLYTGIILMIYYKFVKAVAVVMLILELYSILIYPFFREVKTVQALSKQTNSKAHWYMISLGLAVLFLVLFFPYSWNIELSGEIVPVHRQIVVVMEEGYLNEDLPREAKVVKKGDVLFSLRSKSLEFALQRLYTTLEYDKRLYNLQQVDVNAFSEAQVTEKKIQSDILSIEELNRRKENLQVRAQMDGRFVSKLYMLSKNAFLPRGQQVGEVVSEQLMLYGYAMDREISNLNPGDMATVYTKDSLQKFSAKIVHVNRLSARLKNSPLLQHLGGPIPVYIEEGKAESYSSVLALYRVELEFTEPHTLLTGRTVIIDVHHTEQLWIRIWKLIVSAFRKEF
ncbi:MAG TPA: hypothetical protein P5543_03090 [Planctomycetota bacterium]|nr:hypothetical protein [Planctomycetota bacterium]